ncbi:MmcQ/YjbR family DNA-binding protein [Shinella zoogloeoides]|uniref:MmcQ/YjbR family DNA-binding protein n=1 Tax=Shinella zoogloeoides TaxID=352475 RepID=UPI000E65D47E|nr:MmcQ/YjbR family DNA-binding protein [Shinella zoogloeoides]
MTGMEAIFRNKRVDTSRLIPFGFVRSRGKYAYSTHVSGGRYEMTITITPAGGVTVHLIDAHTKEPHSLHKAPEGTGEDDLELIREYEGVLSRIAEACFDHEIFRSEIAKRLIQHVRDTYRDELQFLWAKFPYNAVFRRQDNGKWYAALLVVKANKIGLGGDDEIEIIDFRVKPEYLSNIIDGDSYFPGYHMNKKHWVTARLDGSVTAEELCSRIDESYEIAARP